MTLTKEDIKNIIDAIDIELKQKVGKCTLIPSILYTERRDSEWKVKLKGALIFNSDIVKVTVNARFIKKKCPVTEIKSINWWENGEPRRING